MRARIPADAEVDLDVPEELRPSTLRRLGLALPLDQKIDNLPPHDGGVLSRLAIHLLQAYRRLRPATIGNRCVFEPSCSRYSELALRTHTLPQAARLTWSRLHRCKPGHGGLDMRELEEPD